MEPIRVRKHAGAEGPLVVLHGGPGAPGSGASLAIELAGEFEVWEPLQRRSGNVKLTVDRHVDDLREVAPNRATIIGWSWGAMLGLSYAARHPERVGALALVGCGTYDDASRTEYERRINANLGDAGRKRLRELRAAMDETRDSAERDRLLALRGAVNAEAQSVDLLPEERSEPIPADAAGHEETWHHVLHRQAAGVEPQSFTAIKAPVLMLHGDGDPHPGPMIRDSLLPYIPHLEYVGIPHCGHEPWRERYGRQPFFETLRAWIDATQRG
jgi:pimeloyl-ACP methyl ester carboxylesterase